MKIIGLTGGIGSGKTTVTDFLQRKGYQVIDADEVAREIVQPGTEVLSELVTHFGEAILQSDGSLNRQKLAELAFKNSAQKEVLDRITHGAIMETISEQIKNIQSQQKPKLIFVDAALLIETGLYKKMDEVWLITTQEDLRIQRVMSRDHMDADKVKQRILAQMSDKQKEGYATRMINNSDSKDKLYEKIEMILREYETV
jgi:dephospho-CoA kinase